MRRSSPAVSMMGMLSLAYVIGWGYACTLTSFWADEEVTAMYMDVSWREMFHILRGDFHPPLFYVLLRLWKPLWAWAGTEFALRSFSLASGLLGLWVWRRLFERILPGSLAPLGAVFLMAATPFMGWYATEARVYQFYVLVCGLAWLSWFRLLEAPENWGRRVLAGFLCACMALSHMTGLIGIGSFVAWLALGWWKEGLSRPQWKAAAWAFLFAAVFFFPQLDTALNQRGRFVSFWSPEPNWNLARDLADYIEVYFTAGMPVHGWAYATVMGLVLAGLLWALGAGPWQLKRALLAAATGFYGLFWAASHVTVPFMINRITLPLAPFIFLALAAALESWGGRRLLALGLGLVFAVSFPVFVLQHLGAGREDMRGAVAYVAKFKKPGDSFLRQGFLWDYYASKAGMKFSLAGERVDGRYWLIRRKSYASVGASWGHPESDPASFRVLARRDFVSVVDDFWTLEVLLVRPVAGGPAGGGFTL